MTPLSDSPSRSSGPRDARSVDLPLRPWPLSLTINSPANKRKALLYVGPREGACRIGYAADTFAEAFGVSETEVAEALGQNWTDVSKDDLVAWLKKVETFTRLAQTRATDASTTPQ